MKQLTMGTALMAALLHCGIAVAQGNSPSPPAGQGVEAMPAKADPPVPARVGASSSYRSPFADYRPFTPQEPPRNWRAANDEVRDVGGHVGLMKSVPEAKAETAKGGKP